MASFDDLGRALRDDAVASAPPASCIDVDAVISAARARRRPRQWAAGTLGLVAVLGLGGIAVAAVTPPTLIAASESADGGDLLLSEEGAVDAPDYGGGDGGGVAAPATSGDERVAEGRGCDRPSGLAVEFHLPSTAANSGESIVRLRAFSCTDGSSPESRVGTVVIEVELVDPATGRIVTVTGPEVPLRLE